MYFRSFIKQTNIIVYVLIYNQCFHRRRLVKVSLSCFDKMSHPCAAPKCERLSRAPCNCCEQNLCLQHLNEHNALLISQLNLLTNEINTLDDRLKTLNTESIINNCRQELKKWRLDCYQKIDHFVEEKSQELDRLAARKLDKQRKEVVRIKSQVAKLVLANEAARQDIDGLTSTVRQLEIEMDKIEQTCFRVSTCPLLIDDNIVQFKETYSYDLNPSILSSVHESIEYSPNSFRSLASNDRVLLIHQAPNLCFLNVELKVVKQVLWPYDGITDICWSSTLDRFIVIRKNGMFLVDENTMSIENVETVEKQNWLSCTCYNTQLFLSTNGWGSSIVEMRLSPSIAIIKEWKSPRTCAEYQLILDIAYNNRTLVVLIKNKIEKPMRIELRSEKTLDRIWSLSLDIVCNENKAFRCCSLTCDEWLVADCSAGRLLHITSDGEIKITIPYTAIPYRVSLFGTKMLAVASEKYINFHEI
jgi:hypothetical protein